MKDYNKEAEQLFTETRDKYRVEAILKARKAVKKLQNDILDIDMLMNEANLGNFAGLVERFVSVNIAEEYE